jgi:hypothetical protein
MDMDIYTYMYILIHMYVYIYIDAYKYMHTNMNLHNQGDDEPGNIPVKKLSQDFDNCAKGEGKGMKVYLRIRPMSSKGLSESTITVESGEESHYYK